MPEGRLVLRTRSLTNAGVRSPTILKNSRLTDWTMYIIVQYVMCGLSALSGEQYSLLR